MSERSPRSRRVRPQISDDPSDDSQDSSHEQDDYESEEADYDPRKVDAMRRSGRQETAAATSVSPRSRARTSGRSSAAISKSYVDHKQSLKLTVKAPPSKLREVMRVSEIEALHDTLGGGQVIEGSRRRRGQQPPRVSHRAADRPRYAEFGESDIEDEDEEDEDMDDDAAGEDDDEDVEMDDPPVPPKAPKITLNPPGKTSRARQSNPTVVVEPPKVGRVLSVEDQEMKDNPGDEEVDDTSELSDDEEGGNDDEQEEADEEEDEEEEDEEADETNLNEEDAPGEEDEVEVDVGDGGENEELEEDDDDSSDESESETPGSGAATPDPTKMTKRQRRALDGEGFMALEMGPQQRKFFTDEEKAMKKDEHARKRKELTKRKIQEEKTAALNRLLKPQASKARGAAPKPETLLALERAGETAMEWEEETERANPLYTRWISTKDGIKLGVPEEWLGKQAGRMFGPPLPPSNGTLVQELN